MKGVTRLWVREYRGGECHPLQSGVTMEGDGSILEHSARSASRNSFRNDIQDTFPNLRERKGKGRGERGEKHRNSNLL